MRFQAPWRSPGDLLQTETDARFLHMPSPLSLLFWLITPTHLSTHKTLQLTGCLTDGRCVDSIRVGQQGNSWRKVTEQQGRAVCVLLLCTLTEFILVGKNEWQPFTKLSCGTSVPFQRSLCCVSSIGGLHYGLQVLTGGLWPHSHVYVTCVVPPHCQKRHII